jgi:nucleotide-binding universal stress UspA family protein
MSLKTVLVHVDDSPHAAARVASAVRISRDVGARLVGLYLMPQLTAFDVALPGDMAKQQFHQRRGVQDAAEQAFHAAAAAGNLKAVEWRAPRGDPLDAAVAHARCADLFVAGQEDRRAAGTQLNDLVVTVLLASGRPVLVVPYIGAAKTFAQSVLVASDGGREAARAIADAMPLLERAERVDVLVGAREGTEEDWEEIGSRLSAWLRDHGIEPRIEVFAPDPAAAGPLLLSRAADCASDLIVMGGYAHARMRQMVLGGMTRTMLEAMTVPVLMSH